MRMEIRRYGEERRRYEEKWEVGGEMRRKRRGKEVEKEKRK